ncbi:MAG: CRTAC1 family protein [Candidatus Aminicenantes bacterium]|nr:CRTAC1 family protein [Candidatus Aminicenantes bacterium]
MKTAILFSFVLTFALIIPLPAAGESEKQQLPVLVDITEKAGITFSHSIGDDKLSNIVESTGAGTGFFDYDGDGDLDIYFVNGSYLKEINHPRGRKLAGKLRNALYRNNGNGAFTDVTARAGVGDRGYGMGCVSADYDNDGDADLFITNYGPNVLYRNNGNGTFTDVTQKAGVGGGNLFSTGCTFLDYDGDGRLDLYVGSYILYDPEYKHYFAAEAFPGPLAYKGRPDILYRNRGNGTFEDVTRKAGVFKPQGRAMGVASCDLDNNGSMDIFIANDAMENYFFRNSGKGTFTEIALLSGTGFGQNGEATSAMGPEFGDFDLDGLMDIMVPDMAYSCLYRNTGKGFFVEMSAQSGIAVACGQYTSWSGNFFDYDNDGLLDIFISNGDSHHLEPEEDLLFRNINGKKFRDVSAQVGKDFQAKFVGRGSAAGDFDNDGDLDILVLNLNDRPRLLRNDGGNRGNWLMVRLIGKRSNRDAIGAWVRLTAGGTTQTRNVISSSGYLSRSDYRLHFGLGKNKKAEKIEIRWPGGKVQVLKNVDANRVLTITERPRGVGSE